MRWRSCSNALVNEIDQLRAALRKSEAARMAAERKVDHLTRMLERLMKHLGVELEEVESPPEPPPKSEEPAPPSDDAPSKSTPEPAEPLPEPPRREPKSKAARNEGHGRSPLPDALPRDIREARPIECPKCAGTEFRDVGQEVAELLDYVPSYVRVRKVVRWTCACRGCNALVTANAPPTPIDKGRCTASFLAWVLYSKYALHLPLERLKGELKRLGVNLQVSTMCGWVDAAAFLLNPLVRRMAELLLATGLVQTDGTGIPVLRRGQDHTHIGQVAVFCSPHWAIYDYTATKEGKHAAAFLDGFEGVLVADASSTFDQLYIDGKIREAGCWAHARRKFEDAVEHEPLAANEALAWIGSFYEVERDARERGIEGDALLALRRERTAPILADYRAWLDGQAATALPKSTLGKAVAYGRRHWAALTRFLDDARLPLDNNLSERCLRSVAVGRNNYMFAGSDDGAARSAVIYSIVMSCKLQGIDPLEYLTVVLDRLSVHPDNRIRGREGLDALLPGRLELAAK